MNNEELLKAFTVVTSENEKLNKENQRLKEQLKTLKEDITAIYNEMIALEIIDKHDDIEEI